MGFYLGQQGLAAAGRSVEEDAAWRRHAEFQELLGMLDRVLDELLELAFHVLQAADVLPAHVGHLDDTFPQSWRIGFAKSPPETRVFN